MRLAGTTGEGVFGSSTGITRVIGGGNSDESLWEKIHWGRVQEFRWGHCIEFKRPRVGNMTISWWSGEERNIKRRIYFLGSAANILFPNIRAAAAVLYKKLVLLRLYSMSSWLCSLSPYGSLLTIVNFL